MAFQVIYLDTSVIADWLFLKSLDEKALEHVSKGAHNSILSKNLIDSLLSKKNSIETITSHWSLCEAVSTLKMSTIGLKLVLDNVSLRYLNRLKDSEYYKLTKVDGNAILESLSEFKSRAKDRIKIIDSKLNYNLINELIIKHCLEASDALHLALAIDNKCDGFITRDEDFIKRNKEFAKLGITIITPKDMINEIKG